MGYPKGISRIFVGSLAPRVQISLEATMEIDLFDKRSSAPPAPKKSKLSHPND